MAELKGKTALVTGGTRGIGKAVALALADMGADIAINFFRSRDAAKAAVAEIEKIALKGDFEHWKDDTDTQLNRLNLGLAFRF